jgi:mannose-1-phosphate guanylyltransferase
MIKEERITTAMILAAGFGLRLRPLTELRPKPLLPVLDQPLLHFWIEKLISLGVKRLVINAHHLSCQIEDALKNLPSAYKNLDLSLSIETEILGTGGGLKKAAALLFPESITQTLPKHPSKAFYVVNSDIHTDLDLLALARTHLSQPTAPATLALIDCPPKATVSLNQTGQIIAFRAPKPYPEEHARLCGAGIMVMERWFLESLPDGFSDSIEYLQRSLIQGRRPGAHYFSSVSWTDIGTPSEYLHLNRRLAKGRILLQQPELIKGHLSGFVLAEAGVIVQPEARIKDSILLKGTTVENGAIVNGAIVAGYIPAKKNIDGGVYI